MKKHIVICFYGWIFLLLVLLYSGCAINKSKFKDKLAQRNIDDALIVKGNHQALTKCFIADEKRHVKSSIEMRHKILGVDTRQRRIRAKWSADSFVKNDCPGTRIVCNELESMIVDYQYVIDFTQINDSEVLIELYGRRYGYDWCGDIVVDKKMLADAAEKGDKAQVRDLLAKITVHDKDGAVRKHFSNLMLPHAVDHGHKDLAVLLRDNGADMNRQNPGRETALHKSCAAGHIETVQMLLENGVAVNVTDTRRHTPLHLACSKGHLEIVQLLVRNGADVSMRTMFDETAFHLACNRGHPDVVRWLIENGADINSTTKHGYSPLIFATMGGRTQVVKVLLEHNADVTLKTNSGSTALRMAKNLKRTGIQELLEAHGAEE